MGGGSTYSQSSQTSDILGSLAQTLPSLYSIINNNVGANAAATSNAALATLPTDTRVTQGQERTLANLGNEFETASIGNRANILANEGRQLAGNLRSTDEAVNPEFYKVAGAGSDALTSLMSGINPNGLDEAELAAIERSVAKDNVGTGNLGVNSPTKTVSNAMLFGKGGADYLAQKRSSLSNAIAAASSFMPASKGVDTNQAVFGKSTYQPSQFANTSTKGAETADIAKAVYGGTSSRTANMIDAEATDPVALGFTI